MISCFTNSVSGCLQISSGVPSCSMCPSFITMIRVPECQCFPDIVCDKNDGHSQFAVNTGNFGLQHFSGDFVDGSERFVHEQDVRIGGQGACNS